jgi:membrane-associated phospholipid phosphatase
MPVQQFGELFANPKNLRNHILKVMGFCFVLAIIAALTLDQKLSLYFADPSRTDIKAFFKAITDIGLSEYYFVGALVVWAVAKWIAPYLHVIKHYHKERDFARRWGINFLLALIFSGILVHITKFLFGRQRPHKSPDFDPFVFHPFNFHWHYQSFASGHSQVMFTVATMMSVALPKLRWLWFLCAATICFSRIAVHDHFLSDTIFGACVGYVGALLAMYFMKRKTSNGLY